MFFIALIQNKDGFLCHGFLLDSKILYLEPKHTTKDFKMVTNKHQEDSTDGDDDLEAMISSNGLQKGLHDYT